MAVHYALCFISVLSRAFYLQILKADYYKEKAISQHERTLTLEPRRGRILDKNKRILAVGTTVIRTLESVALKYGKIVPWKGSTNLFIKPGFQFKIVDCLLTNFHLPKSTLLILICSFFGYKNTFKLYKYAIQKKYRFFSYGDCCFLPIKKNSNG